MKKVAITTQPFAGFAIESADEGETVRVLHSAGITADNPAFYMYINQLGHDFLECAGIDGDSITRFFIVQRSDGGADIYTDYAAVVHAQVNRAVEKGEPVFVEDISAIESYRPAGITLQSSDAVICAMKAGWKYALFFDASRAIVQDHVWRQLGELYRTLHVERVLSNIQERIKLQQRPHVITEGKTDWRHIEAARRALGVDMPLGYPTTDDSLGDSALLQVCERLAKFGPPNANKVIAIFDHDNPQTLVKLKARGDLSGYQSWGNNVYSLVLPKPPHRTHYKNVSIEMLYTDADLLTADANGKRLYFDHELRTEVVPGSPVRYVPIPAVATRELDKKAFDDLAKYIVDDRGRRVGLSKAQFAELVYGGVDGFDGLDVSAFAPVFNVIKDIMASDRS
jgi:hypothetical protein